MEYTQCGVVSGPNSSLPISFKLTADCANITLYIDDIQVTTIPPLHLTCPGPSEVIVNGTGCGCSVLESLPMPSFVDSCHADLSLNSDCVPYGSSTVVWTASREFNTMVRYNYDVSVAQIVPLLVLAPNQVATVYSDPSVMVTPCSNCPQTYMSGQSGLLNSNNLAPTVETYALITKLGSGPWKRVSGNPSFSTPGPLYLALNVNPGFTPSGSGIFPTTVTIYEEQSCDQTILRPLHCPDIVVPCAGNGTMVNYTNSSLSCNPAQCSIPSGSLFPVGNTTVDCTSLGLNCTFTVSVVDTEPPNITCPSSIYQQCG
eukprot:TRINITY_DN6907_c0_g2_i1.p1 TRINITY_DN6907_c0_g2~~TRINITY_DN6907_c0_g2_i1.p1  ORF type:complete len:315 (-),score=16.08 TRINITY_DN6907_c0_g2_i1:244-1188(-)